MHWPPVLRVGTWRNWVNMPLVVGQVCACDYLTDFRDFSDWSNLKLSSDFMKAMILEGDLARWNWSSCSVWIGEYTEIVLHSPFGLVQVKHVILTKETCHVSTYTYVHMTYMSIVPHYMNKWCSMYMCCACMYLLVLTFICAAATKNNVTKPSQIAPSESHNHTGHGAILHDWHVILVGSEWVQIRSSPRLPASAQGTPRIELPSAHERYSAVLPTCHGQNPDKQLGRCFTFRTERWMRQNPQKWTTLPGRNSNF